MKKFIYFSLSLLICITLSCSKDQKNKVLNVTAIDNNSSKIVNVKLATLSRQTLSIGCHDAFSKVFDTKDNIFGYQDCNSVYRLIDVETCKEVKKISLPTAISMVVPVPQRNQIIGHYWDGSDHVVVVNRKNGNIVSDKTFSSGAFWNPTTCFYMETGNEYVLLRSDNVLVFVNPSTGNINRTLSVGFDISNGVYDKKHNRLIGASYSNQTGNTYIVAINLNSGNTLSKVVAQGLDFYLAGERDYDSETNSYILVNSNNEVLFFDVATGAVTESYQLDFDLTSLSVWRSRK